MQTMPKVTALAPWYGAARMIAQHVGEELAGCRWVGVPFAGGMTELLYIDAPTIMASDLHGWVINLARCVADPLLYRPLKQRLENLTFHPVELEQAQQYCSTCHPPLCNAQPNVTAAAHYFVCAWMGRNGKAGTKTEFSGGMSVRWEDGGGDSCVRFRSAVRAIAGWRNVLRRCTFHVLDCFEFLNKCKDQPGIGLYFDPPFPGPGDDYRHAFSTQQHERLAARLREFRVARVVCRFYDTPLIRKMYSVEHWTYRPLKGRDQTNARKLEMLLLNGPSKFNPTTKLF